ncbi:MAG: hypothetical protein WCC26_09710 [Terracidiphilus sp.]
MHPLRGILMVVAAALAFFSATRMRTRQDVMLACVLGFLALALGAWHLMRSGSRARSPRL